MFGRVVLVIKNFWHWAKLFLTIIKYGPIKSPIKLVGITGTDGKTTTANLIYQIIKADGKSVGLVSTISAITGKEELDTGVHTTTPTYNDIKKYLSAMEKNGIEFAVLEITAHGLFQHRVSGLHFVASVLTNITHEHLDYFYSLKAYTNAKRKLFINSEMAVLNRDDSSYTEIAKNLVNITTYSLINNKADFVAKDIHYNSNGSTFKLQSKNSSILDIETPLLGQYNVYNILAAISVTKSIGIREQSILAGIKNTGFLKGRLQQIKLEGADFRVIVDFAHTPNALQNLIINTKRSFKPNKIILVFGAAGLRDKSKRPEMGKVASELSDQFILTAEDPRTESVNSICNDILSGSKVDYKIKGEVIIDRYTAILRALEIAKTNDLVLITGKGHETSMCFGKTEETWNDRDAVVKAWKQIEKKQ